MFRTVKKDSYYYRYKKQAYIIEGGGILCVGIAILLNELTHDSLKPYILVIAGIGMLLLIIGGSSARPHVLVKSFASLLANEPTTKNAQEFIYALECSGTVRLVKSSQATLDSAVMSYERSDDSDEDVADQLRDAIRAHIKNKIM